MISARVKISATVRVQMMYVCVLCPKKENLTNFLRNWAGYHLYSFFRLNTFVE